jgi:hypothetical protein
MPDLDESDTTRAVRRFAELGVETVKQLLANDALPQGQRLLAMRWLASQQQSTGAPSEPAREPKPHHRSTR